jgi:hypothetical protein
MMAPASPTVRWRRLAAGLRRLRKNSSKTPEAVAWALEWSPSKVSRYERAGTALRPWAVDDARLLPDHRGLAA